MAASGSARERAQQHHEQKQAAQTKRQRWLVMATAAVIVVVAGFTIGRMIGIGGGADDGVNFQAATLDGDVVNLSDYRGDVVLVNFWATWCPPCRAEMPTIQTAYDAYSDQGFTVLAVNVAETQTLVRPFVEEYGLNFPILMDPTSRVDRQFGIRSYPTSLFVGRDGEIYATHTGLLYPDVLEDYIQQGL